jgi:hypothetical protein
VKRLLVSVVLPVVLSVVLSCLLSAHSYPYISPDTDKHRSGARLD